MWNFADEYVER